MDKEKLITRIEFGMGVEIIKRDEKYFLITDDQEYHNEEEMSILELSALSKQLSFMVFEHYNPDHHNLKPMGFTK